MNNFMAARMNERAIARKHVPALCRHALADPGEPLERPAAVLGDARWIGAQVGSEQPVLVDA
jgi:hypothetical protein